MKLQTNFKKRQVSKGQSLTEYGLILALIAVVCIGTVQNLGGAIKTKLAGLTASISGTP